MLLSLLMLAAAPTPAGSILPPPAWEKVFEASATDGFVSSVRAIDREEWFVGGTWGVTRVTRGGRETKRTPAPVSGVFAENANSIFAFGFDGLILHSDGKDWVQEHFAPSGKQGRRRYDDLLHSAFYVANDGHGAIVAFGPHAVLERQSDGSWHVPDERERDRLSWLAQSGPADRPPGCFADAWFWIQRDLAWFTCQDRRTFILDGDRLTPKARMPAACPAVTRVAYGAGEVYVACAERGVWRTEGQTWRKLPRPRQDGAYFDVSVADKCVFVTDHRTVWRRCEP